MTSANDTPACNQVDTPAQNDPVRLIASIDSLLSQVVVEDRVDDAGSLAAAAMPFDLEGLLHRCLGDRAFCRMIVQKFADRGGDLITAMERAANSGNAAELAAQAHSIKGVAANLSADDLRACAGELERIARSGNLDLSRPLVERVANQIARALEAAPAAMERIAAGHA
jgi:HPt (histidine-containing phosphotransfer) domain-containing protein